MEQTEVSKKFRLNSKKLFLTYPKNDTTKQTVAENLHTYFGKNLEGYSVGQEYHQDGTLHLHVCVFLKEKVDIKGANTLDVIAGRHGNYQSLKKPKNCIEYTMKDDKEVLLWGTVKQLMEGGKGTHQKIVELVKTGKNIQQIDEDFGSFVMMNKRKLEDYIAFQSVKNKKLEDTEEQMYWYYGKTGTGKSRKATSENPGHYKKMCNKWWDDYVGQEVAIIEDFDIEHKVLCHHLKIWGDRYPFPVEVKGGKRDIRPKRIIVTSNYHPKQIWTDEKDYEPIMRRFKVVHFGKPEDKYQNYDFSV